MSRKRAQHIVAQERLDLFRSVHTNFQCPVDYLLHVMNGIDKDGNERDYAPELRVSAAKGLIGYLYPKLSALTITDTAADDLTDEEKQQKIKELLSNPNIRALLDEPR